MRLRGLPFAAREEGAAWRSTLDLEPTGSTLDHHQGLERRLEDEIRACFADFRLSEEEENVVILRRTSDGLPTGHALVYFADWEEPSKPFRVKKSPVFQWISVVFNGFQWI